MTTDSNFFAEDVKDRVRKIYIDKAREFSRDDLFIENIKYHKVISQEQLFQSAAIIIMAKYFEICDIFEEPK